MPITDPIFLTTFQGSTITRDGVTYVWVNGKYEISTSISSTTKEALLITRTVFLKFYGVLNPDVNLSGNELQVFIDGQEWTGEYRIENQTSVEIKLDEPFIRTQRLITFKTLRGNPKHKYAIKSNVYQDKDVVVAKLGIGEDIPILGTAQIATPIYTEPIYNVGTSNTGNTSNIALDYESTTVQIGVGGFNTNNQIVDATIGEVVGPTIL